MDADSIKMKEKDILIRLEIKSHPRYLGLVRNATYDAAKIAGFSEEDAKDLKLVIDEACTNVIKHSYHYDYTMPIIFDFYIYDDRFEVIIQDFGEKVNPANVRPRDVDMVRPGGLGVYIIKKLTDVMEYDPTVDEGPRLRLVKYKKKL